MIEVPSNLGLWYVFVPAVVLLVFLMMIRRAASHGYFPFRTLETVALDQLDDRIAEIRFMVTLSTSTLAMFSTCVQIASWPDSTRHFRLSLVSAIVYTITFCMVLTRRLEVKTGGRIYSTWHTMFMMIASYTSGPRPVSVLLSFYALPVIFQAFMSVTDVIHALFLFMILGVYITLIELGALGVVSHPWMCGACLEKASEYLPVVLVLSIIVHTLVGDILATYKSLRLTRFFEEAARMKDDFLATVSHDIRTPLNGIIACSTLLDEDRRLAPAQREQVNVIAHCSSVLSLLVENVLISGMRRTECVWEDTPLRDFFDRYFNILQNLVFGSDIVFELRYMQPKMPKVLRLPKSHMMQVLLNLGSNAIKYDGKEITLLVDYREEEKELVVEVQDRGLGISDEFVRSRLFSKYERDHEGGGALKASGTGLGLNICQRLCESMGADLGYRPNTGGKGSVFYMHLPLRKTGRRPSTDMVSEPHVTSSSRDESGQRRRPDRALPSLDVLVVDDSSVNIRVVEMFISRLSDSSVSSFQSVSDGVAAIQILLKRARQNVMTPLLVLMDLQMPLLDGLQTAQNWRRLERDIGMQPARLVAVTAGTISSMDGFDAYLPKPIKPGQLSEQVLAAKYQAP